MADQPFTAQPRHSAPERTSFFPFLRRGKKGIVRFGAEGPRLSRRLAGLRSLDHPEAARREERGVGGIDGLAASTAATVREVGIDKAE